MSLLTTQVDHELGDLTRLAAVLRDVAPETAAGQAVLDRFALLVTRVERRFTAARDTAAHDQGAAWTELAAARGQAAKVKAEALAFVYGALLREKDLDGGAGVVSERLLDELTRRTGIDRTVLFSVAEAEFFRHTASMVRGRFPDTTVWNLPVLAHELGHHVAQTLEHADPELRTDIRPVMDYLSAEADAADTARPVALAHLHELFADVYATYVLGAAYPLNLVVLNARPDGFHDHTNTHPSWRRRVHTVAAAVRVLGADRGPGAAGYRMVAETLTELWDTGAGLAAEDHALTENQAAAMVSVLAEHTVPRARYAFPERLGGIGLTGAEAETGPGVTVSDVLNAAWLWRLANPAASARQVETAGRRAIALCWRMNPS